MNSYVHLGFLTGILGTYPNNPPSFLSPISSPSREKMMPRTQRVLVIILARVLLDKMSSSYIYTREPFSASSM